MVDSPPSQEAYIVTASIQSDSPPGTTVCLGLDALDGEEQLGLAFTRDGLVAMGRKFFPTDGEIGYLQQATSAWTEEAGLERIVTFAGRRFYIAVCYDSFGIRKQQIKNRQADAILNLVHGFATSGQPAEWCPVAER